MRRDDGGMPSSRGGRVSEKSEATGDAIRQLPGPAPARMRERLWLVLATLGLLIPFIGKPFHLDDPVYLAVVRQVLAHPLNPYGFEFNWHGSAVPMWTIMLNPPGLGYVLAPAVAAFGERETVLHLLFLVFPLLASQAAYDLARRFTAAPFPAALLTVLAPMFLVSSTALMADVPALGFSLLSLAALFGAIEGRRGAAWLSGLAASAAILIKYNSLYLIPLLALGGLLFHLRSARLLPAIFLPLLALAGWEVIHFGAHGESHLLAASRIVRAQRPDTPQMILATAAFVFLGAGSAPVLLAARLRARDAVVAVGAGLVAGIGLVLLYRSVNPRFAGWGTLPMATALAGAGGLAWIALAIREGLSRRREDLFLLMWLGGTLIQAAAFSNFVASRFLLPALFPAVVLSLRRAGPRVVLVAGVVSALLSLAVSRADLDLARGYRDAAGRLHARYGGSPPRLRFQGHWGFQYYLERFGHRPLDDAGLDLAPGDIIATPRWAPDLHYRFGPEAPLGGLRFLPEDLIEIRSRVPVTVMNRDTGAGFYSMNWGPLPYAWAADPIERIEVVRVLGSRPSPTSANP